MEELNIVDAQDINFISKHCFYCQVLEDENLSKEVRREIYTHIKRNMMEPDIYKDYIKPEYSLKLVKQICQILDCYEIDIKERNSMINLLVIQG